MTILAVTLLALGIIGAITRPRGTQAFVVPVAAALTALATA